MARSISNTEGSDFEALRQILIRGMHIAEERVNIFNQRIDPELLKDPGIFIYLECMPSKVIANRISYQYDPVSGFEYEVQDLNMSDPVTIGVFSKSIEAFQRKEEVLMAINSTYSQQLQEELGFRIFRNAPIQDLSVLEGAALLFRYDIPVMMFTWRHKRRKIETYDSYKVEVKVNDGLPVITKTFDQPESSSSSSMSSSSSCRSSSSSSD
jgi:hypothetical protein